MARFHVVIETNAIHDDTIRRQVINYLVGTSNWNQVCFECGGSDGARVGEDIVRHELSELLIQRILFLPSSET
jgi:hypothetical protein